MIKSIARILLILAGIIIAVILAVYLSLKLAFPEPKLKKLAADGIRGYSMRETRIGSLSWGLGGVEIRDFALSRKPSFSMGKFLTVEKISYKAVFPPGSGSGRLLLESPALTVECFTDELGFSEKVRGYHMPPFASVSVRNGRMDIESGTAGNIATSLSNIQLDLKAGRGGKPFSGSLSMDIFGSGKEASIKADITADLRENKIAIDNAKVTVGGKYSFLASGSVTDPLLKGETEYTFEIEGDRAALDEVIDIISKTPGLLQYSRRDKVKLSVFFGKGGLKVIDRLNVR